MNGWHERFRKEDSNKVVKDAHRVVPGFSQAISRNLRSMRLARAFDQSLTDVLRRENPKLFAAKGGSRKVRKAPAQKLAA